jgi:osmotically-inducible protein OsmY
MNALLEIAQLSTHASNAVADRICRAVLREFSETNYSQLRQVQCGYRHGVLHLHGQVDSFFLKQLAQEHARRVEGVTHLVNAIHVIENQKAAT